MQEGCERAQHVLDVEVGEGPDVVEADLLDRDPVLVARLVVIDGVDRHQRHSPGQERQPRRDVVAATNSELIGHRTAPEQTAGAVRRQLEGVHEHLGAGVPSDLLTQFRREHHRVPIFDHRLSAVGVDVADGEVDRSGWGCGLAGAVHPVREHPPGAVVRCCPLQPLVMDLVGQIDDGVDVQDGSDLGLLQHAGSDNCDQHLLADHAALPGKVVAGRRGGREVDSRQGSAAGGAGGKILADHVEFLGRRRLVGVDGREVGVRPVRAGGEAHRHVPLGRFLDDDLRVMNPLLSAPSVAGVVDVTLVHGQEFHPSEPESVSGVDLVPQRLVGVEPLRKPPTQFGTVLKRRVLDELDEVVHDHDVLLRTTKTIRAERCTRLRWLATPE